MNVTIPSPRRLAERVRILAEAREQGVQTTYRGLVPPELVDEYGNVYAAGSWSPTALHPDVMRGYWQPGCELYDEWRAWWSARGYNCGGEVPEVAGPQGCCNFNTGWQGGSPPGGYGPQAGYGAQSGSQGMPWAGYQSGYQGGPCPYPREDGGCGCQSCAQRMGR